MPASPETISALRRQLGGLSGQAAEVLPFGDARIDAHLPGGGLPVGQLHEIGADGIEAETGALCGGFAASLAGALARRGAAHADQVLLWVARRCDLYAPGLLAYGIDPGRVILAQTGSDAETLQAMETALRSGAAFGVVGEVGRITRLAARRLHLACLNQNSTGLVLRRWPHGRKPGLPDGNEASTRWRLSPAPGLQRGVVGDRSEGGARWRVELLHARGGRPGAWIMRHQREADDGDDDAAHPLRVVAVLGDDTAAPCQGEACHGEGWRAAG